ncbi:SHOCT domain-containing protein [Mucilaginibacter sp. cycad4]|uniref:SHOCT domain-containing protein n=1 Tax=Mucilaginibacter sp. cycad4 TaxID=3342096 RepID=UPI002AAB220C|nr:SHOCT domain-containing protein [Mucilaginibacter gossypii]WPU99437.1 SHOCT domain-containing protein [Mucilaginibacter gossypii]
MGGLGAPEIILIVIALGLMLGYAILFPVWGYNAGSKRTIGAVPGLFLGLFLNFIGIIIVYCSPRIQNKGFYDFPKQSSADELQKFKQLFDSGAITESEYNAQKNRILNSGYKEQY